MNPRELGMIFKDDSGYCSEVGFIIINVEFPISAVRKRDMSSSELLLL
jgi:hypothetical protein